MQSGNSRQRLFFTADNVVTVGALVFLCACFAAPGLRMARFQESEKAAIERVTFESLRDSLALASASRPLATASASVEALAPLVPVVLGPRQARPNHDEHIRFVSQLIKAHKTSSHEAESLAHAIVSESAKAKYDPIFVAAVIYAESMFKHGAVSHKGAQGLMQIMPETGRYLSARENLAWGGTRSLKDPKTNLRLGIAYLKQLETMFNGNRERMLIAYNWGPANLSNALRGRGRAPMESIGYARKIISTHRKWKSQFTQLATAGDRRFVG
jgi:soluble lytic murein transglycosylase-like protein